MLGRSIRDSPTKTSLMYELQAKGVSEMGPDLLCELGEIECHETS